MNYWNNSIEPYGPESGDVRGPTLSVIAKRNTPYCGSSCLGLSAFCSVICSGDIRSLK
ncbi:hypothetical protein ES703_25237 [subsurface metagenome]